MQCIISFGRPIIFFDLSFYFALTEITQYFYVYMYEGCMRVLSLFVYLISHSRFVDRPTAEPSIDPFCLHESPASSRAGRASPFFSPKLARLPRQTDFIVDTRQVGRARHHRHLYRDSNSTRPTCHVRSANSRKAFSHSSAVSYLSFVRRKSDVIRSTLGGFPTFVVWPSLSFYCNIFFKKVSRFLLLSTSNRRSPSSSSFLLFSSFLFPCSNSTVYVCD